MNNLQSNYCAPSIFDTDYDSAFVTFVKFGSKGCTAATVAEIKTAALKALTANGYRMKADYITHHDTFLGIRADVRADLDSSQRQDLADKTEQALCLVEDNCSVRATQMLSNLMAAYA